MGALEEVLEKVNSIYSLALPPEQETAYHEFQVRQKRKKRAGKDGSSTVELDAHKLFVFSLYLRHTGVLASRHHTERTILDSWERLKLLKARGSDGFNWEDRRLYTLYRSTTQRKSAQRKLTYTKVFDEVGSDPVVIALWGRKIIYDKDISSRGEQKYVTRW